MTKAAHELEVTPSAISQQIKILEMAMGLKLVTRTGSQIFLTEAGASYHKAISKVFADLHKANSEVGNFHGSNVLTISSLPLMASRWLSANLFVWQETHPDVHFKLDGTAVEPILDDKPFDFRITYGDKAHLYDYSLPLFTDCLTPVCSPAHAASHPLAQPHDLLGQRLLSIDWSQFLPSAPQWHDWFRLVGIDDIEIIDVFKFSHSSLAIEAAIEGQGIALVQRSLIAEELRTGQLLAPFAQVIFLPSPYILAWSATVFDKYGTSEFHRWIVRLAHDLGPMSVSI